MAGDVAHCGEQSEANLVGSAITTIDVVFASTTFVLIRKYAGLAFIRIHAVRRRTRR